MQKWRLSAQEAGVTAAGSAACYWTAGDAAGARWAPDRQHSASWLPAAEGTGVGETVHLPFLDCTGWATTNTVAEAQEVGRQNLCGWLHVGASWDTQL